MRGAHPRSSPCMQDSQMKMKNQKWHLYTLYIRIVLFVWMYACAHRNYFNIYKKRTGEASDVLTSRVLM